MGDGKVVRLGFIGAGWWATSNHMPILAQRSDVKLEAVCRLGKDELAKVKEHFGFPYATEDYRALLDEAELDGVVVTSPHSLHYEHARAALEKGLHVMCEKPMCIRADHARELVRVAKEKGLHLLVPYGWHYKPYIREAKRRLDSGVVGKIEYVLCHMASPIRGLLRGEGFQYGEMFFGPDPATWADPKVAGGGYGHSQMSHSLGMLFWLTGLRARRAFAVMSAVRSKVELYDALAVEFDGGAIGSLSGAGTAPERFQVDIRVFGSEAMLLLDVDRPRMEVHTHDGKHEALDLAPDAGDYTCEGPPGNFVDLILGKTGTNWAPGEAAMRSVELLDAAYRSAASGRAEEV